MKHAHILLLAVLAGCASKPPAPAWQGNARSALDASVDSYLQGDSAVAEAEFARARKETASTGRPGLVARAELVRCAAHLASLDTAPCSGFLALAADASAADQAYAAYLGGQWQGMQTALLPPQHRLVAEGKGSPAAIAEPLARLVASGAALQAGRLSPADIGAAIEAASAQGWRRPLMAWLGVAVQRAEAAGDSAEVARLRRRLALL